MSSKALCKMLRASVVAIAICGLVACVYIFPAIGEQIVHFNPEYSHWPLPWLIFLWITAAPCFVILILIWKVAAAIKQERVFTNQTARLVKAGSLLMFGSVIFFFVGNIVFLLLGMSHQEIYVPSLFVIILGMALAVSAAILSRYLIKASMLQEEADGTI